MGALSVRFDVWDPQGGSPNNTANVKGRLTLYVRPHVTPGGTGGTEAM